MSTSSSSSSSFSGTSSSSTSSYDDSSFSLFSASIRQFSLEEIKIATNNFDKERVLGGGGEATVYKAELHLNTKTQKTWGAVKHLSKNSDEFEKEIQIVSKIQHPYIVALHGYCNESGEKILIYEYMKNGSLSDYVKHDSTCLTWEQRLNICLDAAYGLQHLHKETTEFSKGIIHRDVKPANILLDENWVAKVSDFGMFKLSESAQIQSTMITDSRKGTPGYFAPEYYMSRHITRKTDVYAFGVVLFEVLCRKKPWDRGDVSWFREENEDLGAWARENVDIEIKKDILSDALKIFTDALGKCLEENPKKRPTMDGVVQSLQLAITCQELQRGNNYTDQIVRRFEEKLSDTDTEEHMPQQVSSELSITLTKGIFGNCLDWLRSLLPKQEMVISLIGLETAGKTSFADAVATGEFSEDMIHTVEFNLSRVIKGNVTITVWDLGGHRLFRSMWETYCYPASVIVYVVDAASDRDNLIIAKCELHDLLSKPSVNGIPLLLLGNKIDKPGALSKQELIDEMELNSITDREVCCFMISCKTSTNIDLVIDWLIKHSKSMN